MIHQSRHSTSVTPLDPVDRRSGFWQLQDLSEKLFDRHGRRPFRDRGCEYGEREDSETLGFGSIYVALFHWSRKWRVR